MGPGREVVTVQEDSKIARITCVSLKERKGAGAKIAVLRQDVKSVRERLEAKIIRLEGVPSRAKFVEKLKEADSLLADVDAKFRNLLKMKGVK